MCSGGSCALNAGRRHAMEMRFVQRGGEQRLGVGLFVCDKRCDDISGEVGVRYVCLCCEGKKRWWW
jgi:hypothetical protein